MDLCRAVHFTALALNAYARKDCARVINASLLLLGIVEDLLKMNPAQKARQAPGIGVKEFETRLKSIIDVLISLAPRLVFPKPNDCVLDLYDFSELVKKHIQPLQKSEDEDLLADLKISEDPSWFLMPFTTLLNAILEPGDLRQSSVHHHYRSVLDKILETEQGWQTWVYLNRACGTRDMYVLWLRERAATDPSSNIQVFPEISYCPVCGGYIEGVLITSEMQLELWLMCPSCAFIWREQHEYRNKWRKLIDQAFPWF